MKVIYFEGDRKESLLFPPKVLSGMILVTAVPTLILGIYWVPIAEWIQDSLVFFIQTIWSIKLNDIQIKRGHDIRVSGVPNRDVISAPTSKTVSVLPNSFKSVKPKLMIQEGDEVKIGSPLFFDKTKPEVR